ncbi:MAG: glycosyltransferase [Thermodesulfobacteriota bacterium]
MKMVVLHSIHVWLSQTNTWLYNLVRFLPNDIESHIACEEISNLDQFFVPNIHRLNNHSIGFLLFRRSFNERRSSFLTQIVKKKKVTILHSHFADIAYSNIEPVRQTGLKHVVSFYGVDVNYMPTQESIWRKRYKDLFYSINKVLCEGPHMASCIERLGCPKEKIRLHHLGVNIDEIQFKPRRWKKGELLRILIAASFREKKGIPYAIEALARLSNHIPMEITLIGDAHPEQRSQEEKRKILQAIERLGLKSKVRRLGYQPYKILLEEAYKHHIFLSPSITASDGDTEGGAPVSIIEMMASGMPVVSTFHCDIPEVIRHGVSGLLAPERDIEGLAAQIEWYIEHPEEWDKMIEVGRRKIEDEYNARKQGEHLAQIYREIIYQ